MKTHQIVCEFSTLRDPFVRRVIVVVFHPVRDIVNGISLSSKESLSFEAMIRRSISINKLPKGLSRNKLYGMLGVFGNVPTPYSGEGKGLIFEKRCTHKSIKSKGIPLISL